eukprot:scaffold2093_cov245-Chaetoceros_neogracile.AAC.4
MESDLATAAHELQELQQWEMEQKATAKPNTKHRRFPPSCLGLLRGIAGSHRQLGVQLSPRLYARL